MPVLKTELSGAKMPLPGGREYQARVLSIEEVEATNPTPEQLEKGDTSYLRWKFVTTDDEGEFGGIELTANSSMKFGTKSKTRKWANALMRTTLDKDYVLDTDDLIGLVGAIYVEEDRKDADRVYAKITDLNRA